MGEHAGMDALVSLVVGVVIGAGAYLALTVTRIRGGTVQLTAMVAVVFLTAALTERPSIIAAGLAVLVLVAFVVLGQAVRHLHDLCAPARTFEQATGSLPAPFTGGVNELRRAGFAPAPQGALRHPRTGLFVSHLAREDGLCATVLGAARGQPRVEVWSLLDGGGSLLTSFEAKLASPPGQLRQVFPGATPTEMVHHHERALGGLVERGAHALSVSVDELRDRAEERAGATRTVLAVGPARVAATAMWRELTGRQPDRGALAERDAAPD
jgi:hypothetical protein